MEVEKIIKTFNDIECFKNTRVDINKNKDIYDIYTRCFLSEDDFNNKIKKIDNLKCVTCDFGIFEIMIKIENIQDVLNEITKVF